MRPVSRRECDGTPQGIRREAYPNQRWYRVHSPSAADAAEGFIFDERKVFNVDVQLSRAGVQDAQVLHRMQVEAFAGHLETYRDYGTNPGAESIDRVRAKLEQEYTYFYYIVSDGVRVGAVRVVDRNDGGRKRISPLFILPEYRNRGYAQAAIREVEHLHGADGWSLGTILQEPGNCHLYEKLGYRRSGEQTVVNERLTVVGYEK